MADTAHSVPRCPVRIPPLGSPWATPKRSYVHGRGVLARASVRARTDVAVLALVGSWQYQRAGWVGILGGYYPPPPTHPVLSHGTCTHSPARPAPQSPLEPALGASLGSAWEGAMVSADGPQTGLRRASDGHQPQDQSQDQPQDQYRRDSPINILKLVINPECHRKRSMRPGILPVSKTG